MEILSSKQLEISERPSPQFSPRSGSTLPPKSDVETFSFEWNKFTAIQTAKLNAALDRVKRKEE